MQLIKNRDNLGQLFFQIGVFLEMVVMMTDHMSAFELPYRGRVTHVAFALFFVAIFFGKYSYSQLIIIFIAACIGVLSYYSSGEEYVIRCVVFVAAGLGIDIETALKIIFWGAFSGTAIIILLSLFGISGSFLDYREYGRGYYEARYCLGFNHANNVHDMFWYLCALGLFIYREKCGKKTYFVLFVTNILLYMLTRSRNGLLLSCILLIGYFCSLYSKRLNDNILFYLQGVVATLVCLWLTWVAANRCAGEDNGWLFKADRILNGRLELIWEIAPRKSWKLFPYEQSSAGVDNAFASIANSYGIIVIGLLVAIIIISFIISCSRHNGMINTIMLSTVFALFVESTYVINVSILCNLVLIAVACNDHYINNCYQDLHNQQRNCI